MIWIGVALTIIFLIIVAALSKVCIQTVYAREGHDDQLDVKIRALFGVIRYRYSLPSIKFEGIDKGFSIERKKKTNIPVPETNDHITIDRKKIITWYEQFKELVHHVIGFHHWLMSTLKHTHCTQISWVTNVGVDDAAETAITTGMIWGLKTSILGVFSNRIKLVAQPQLAVVPHFNQTMFNTRLNCMIKIRLGYALLAGLYLLVRISKVKGGIRTWQRALTKS